jgi:hypothetical protein
MQNCGLNLCMHNCGYDVISLLLLLGLAGGVVCKDIRNKQGLLVASVEGSTVGLSLWLCCGQWLVALATVM